MITNTLKYHIRLLCLMALAVISVSAARAQTFTASVNKNPVGLNEQFQLTFTLNGSGSGFKSPSLTDFMVLSGPNQSTSMQFINGAVSQSVSYSFILQARKEGTFKLEPATIESGGKVVLSNILTINVVPGSSQGNKGGSQGQDDKTNISSSNIFIRVVVDKTNVYRGEAITASFLLYTNVDVVNYSINKIPALNGFWSQDIQLPQQLRLYNEVYKGVNYRVGEIKKVVLFPQQSGTLTIDPMEGECIARIPVKRNRSGNPFDIFNDPFFNDPFFGSGGVRDVRFAVKSDPIKIQVKGLPPNPPVSFNGAVGKFAIEGTIDKTQVKSNDAVNFRLRVNGKGNLKLLEAPVLETGQEIESYDPKVTDNISTTEKGSSGTRTFEYLLIPRHQGKYQIGPVEFSYFDLDKRDYVTLKTPAYTLEVERGKDGASALSLSGKSDFKVIGRDIRFIKTHQPDFNAIDSDFYGSWFFYVLSLLPFAGIFGLILLRKHHLSINSDAAAVKSRKATRMARKRLEIASKYLRTGDQAAFYNESARAIWGYLGDKLRIPPATLNKDSASAGLLRRNVSESLVNELSQLLDTCEYARFARMADDAKPDQIYSRTVSLITRIEDEIV